MEDSEVSILGGVLARFNVGKAEMANSVFGLRFCGLAQRLRHVCLLRFPICSVRIFRAIHHSQALMQKSSVLIRAIYESTKSYWFHL